jgi:hypothetical protein
MSSPKKLLGCHGEPLTKEKKQEFLPPRGFGKKARI